MIVTSNLIQTPKVVTIDQNRWSRSVKFTGHDLLEWVVTVDQNTQNVVFTCVKVCFLCFVWTTFFCLSKNLFKNNEIRWNQSIYVFPLFLVWLICYELQYKPYTLFLGLLATQLCPICI